MPSMDATLPLVSPEKSTTGRLISAGVRVLDTVAPAAAQRLAFDWFGMPRRRAEKPFILGHRFRVTGDGPDLAVWDWGDGRTVLEIQEWHPSLNAYTADRKITVTGTSVYVTGMLSGRPYRARLWFYNYAGYSAPSGWTVKTPL